jgi:hypothetical protein
MKKFFIGMVASTLFLTANAQVSFGPKAGLNLSSVTQSPKNPEVVIDPIIAAFNAGGFVNYKFASQLAGQVELFYSGEGTKFKNKGNPTVFTESVGYLNIPLLFKYASKGGFYVETGPQLGFLLSASESESDVSGSNDVKDNFSSTKFSWCFGLGFLRQTGLGFGLRYAAGLSDLDKVSSAGTSLKGSVLSVSLYYAIKSK